MFKSSNLNSLNNDNSSKTKNFISRIKIQNFRSYKDIDLNIANDHVILYGPNGSGKTNLLEAISLLAPGRGLRSSKKEFFPYRLTPSESYHEEWAIHFTINNGQKQKEISTGIKAKNNNLRSSRLYKVDGNLSKQNEVLSLVSINWLTPQMNNIILGPESLRRSFFDRMIAGLDPSHLGRLKKLEKLYRERAQLIERNVKDESWLSVIEREISQISVAVIVARQNLTSKLDKIMANPNNSFFPAVRILWIGKIEEWLKENPALYAEDMMADYLKKIRHEKNFNSCGPSYSALRVWHVSSGMTSEYCSTGQQKNILISMVLAYSKLLSSYKKIFPILLLDEVSAHLDSKHFQALFDEALSCSSQIWMTGNDKNTFKKLDYSGNPQYFVVNDSIITQPVDL